MSEVQPDRNDPAGIGRIARDWRAQMGAIIALALIPRAIYFVQIQSWPFFQYPILDSRIQYNWAKILVGTGWLGNPEVTAKAPLYSYFLAVHHWVFCDPGAGSFLAHLDKPGPELPYARLTQLALGAITCGFVYLLGSRAFGRPVGLLAGILGALYSPGIYREGQLLDTSLATFLATALALALLGALEKPSTGKWLGSGLLLGLLGLTRPNLLLLAVPALALAAVWLRRRAGKRGAAGLAAVFVLGVVLPIIPITIRNAKLVRGFVAISSFGGINLYTGNNLDSDGYSPIPSGIAWERTFYTAAAAAGAMTTSDRDAYWRGQALLFWRRHPGAALSLLIKKLYLYWNAYEIPNNVSYDWGRQHSSVLRLAPVTFAVVGPLGLLGILLGGWRSRPAWLLTLLVAGQMAAVLVFFVCGRYRMPAVPMLCVFAAFAVVQLVRWAWGRRLSVMVGAVAALGVFVVLVNSDAYGVRGARGANRDSYYLGQSYVLAGEHSLAREAFLDAVERHPHDADALSLLGEVEAAMGQPEAAAEHFARALEAAPDYTTTAIKLVELHLIHGWPLDSAADLLQEALRRQPHSVSGFMTLARVNLKRGDLDAARESILRAHEEMMLRRPDDTRTVHLVAELAALAIEARRAGVELPEMPLESWMNAERRSGR